MQDDRQRPQPARRQNGMSRRALENGFSTISVLILMLLMVIGVGFLIFFPRSKQSVIEKRELTTFPSFSFASYFSGEFTAGVTNGMMTLFHIVMISKIWATISRDFLALQPMILLLL